MGIAIEVDPLLKRDDALEMVRFALTARSTGH
jgi:hypothetical protein